MNTPRQPLYLDEIQARADAATDGPWMTGDRWRTGDVMHPWEVVIADDHPSIELRDTPQGRADAEFIAAARTTVPRLVAEVRDLQNANERLQGLHRAALEALRGMHREALDRNGPLAGELRDRRTEDLNVRGVLSPNGFPRVVPMELGASVVPAVQWLVAEVESLRATRDRRHLLGIIERLRAERDGLAAQLGEATIKAVVTTGPVVQVAKGCPNCPPGYDCESGNYATTADPDTPEAVECELLRLAAETGEPIETVRAAYRVCGNGNTTPEGDTTVDTAQTQHPCGYHKLLADFAYFEHDGSGEPADTCEAEPNHHVEIGGDKAGALLDRVCTRHDVAIREHPGFRSSGVLRQGPRP